MPRPKAKKPSPELLAVTELLKKMAKEDALLVWEDRGVRTVKNIRFGHDEDGVPVTLIFDV